ncbi:nuclear transport factor 2 family protein [Arthrobacter sp. ISL-28]|uniref:nuclear transport factor 2 family protein n=1 Tax=Arthrobacter sp. ISL-28 TaxID=2819108 RepID=UPI001BE7B40E|nr:nuclear transport factor 2 family protein [Arthrobacter sp. ISL-28]MBT2523855.1 nuclear transport factor 2 family protein [Arthrobacter sp. ISL-28]
MVTIQRQLDSLVAAISRAEAGGDVEQLDAVLAPDFTGVGPAGFVLGRDQWMERFANGLVNESFELAELDWRIHDGVAVGIGIQRQRTTYQGHRNDGNFRLSLIAVPSGPSGQPGGDWRLLGLHLSPIMAPTPNAGRASS